MRFKADMAVYDKTGQLALVVEAKNKLGTSSNWATKMRRNILAHGLMPNTPFFLLALPDRFYLWKDAGIVPELVPPNYEIDPRPFLQSYYDGPEISLNSLAGESFELVISSWLSKLLQTDILPPELQEQGWLIETGLFEVIKLGHLAAQVAV
ncbi:MAG: hypothetical protein KDI62_21805 [Anaerolineae bacterium]|nr:hypothetical protein [Anaerolineae bacterium]MCB9104686.1 hypothetical protein [Anaerolineales bacterium]